MHAHIGIWKLNDAGASSSDTMAREIGEFLQQQGGFHSYTLVRTDEQEVVAVTVFETAAQLHDALSELDGLIRLNLRHLSDGAPHRFAGEVVYDLNHVEPD